MYNTILLIANKESNEILLHVVDCNTLKFYKENTPYHYYKELGKSEVVKTGIYSLKHLPFNFIFHLYKKEDEWTYNMIPAERILFNEDGYPVVCGSNDECSNHVFQTIYSDVNFDLDEATQQLDRLNKVFQTM